MATRSTATSGNSDMTDKTWRFALAGYVAFYCLAIAIERHGLASPFQRAPMTASELFLTVPFFWGYTAYALLHGSIHGASGWQIKTIERDDRLAAYWLTVAFYFLYGVFLIVLGLHR
jgi:hypothetical protein